MKRSGAYVTSPIQLVEVPDVPGELLAPCATRPPSRAVVSTSYAPPFRYLKQLRPAGGYGGVYGL